MRPFVSCHLFTSHLVNYWIINSNLKSVRLDFLVLFIFRFSFSPFPSLSVEAFFFLRSPLRRRAFVSVSLDAPPLPTCCVHLFRVRLFFPFASSTSLRIRIRVCMRRERLSVFDAYAHYTQTHTRARAHDNAYGDASVTQTTAWEREMECRYCETVSGLKVDGNSWTDRSK